MPLVNFQKSFDSFPSIFARILMFEHFRGDWAYAEPNFSGQLSKKYFFQNFHFGPIRWVSRWLFKISIIYSQNFHFNLVFLRNFQKLQHASTWKRFHLTLSIRETNFCACSASGKMWTVFKCTSMLSICETHFFAYWAYAERISSHTEHMQNGFHRWLSIRRNV